MLASCLGSSRTRLPKYNHVSADSSKSGKTSLPYELKPLADLQPIIDTLRQAKADDASALYEEKKLRLECERQKTRRIRNLQDKSALRMSDTKLAIQNHKIKLLEEMENNVRAHIEHETISDIREAVYSQEAEIADNYKSEIEDQTRKRLVEELESVIKSQLAARFEGEVKSQVIAELKEELKTQLEPTLREEIAAGLRERVKAELKVTLRAEIEAELKENRKPELEATLQANIEANSTTRCGFNRFEDRVPASPPYPNNIAQPELDTEIYEQYDINGSDIQIPTSNTRQDQTVQAKIEAVSGSQKGSTKPEDYLYTLETQQAHVTQYSTDSGGHTHSGFGRPSKRHFSDKISQVDNCSSKRIKESPSDDQQFDFSEMQNGQVYLEQAFNDQDLALLSSYNGEYPANDASKDERPKTSFTQDGEYHRQSEFDEDDTEVEVETDEDSSYGYDSEEEDDDDDDNFEEQALEDEEEIGSSGVIKWTNTQDDALVIDSDDEDEDDDKDYTEKATDEDQTLVEEGSFVAINGKGDQSSGPIFDDGLLGY